MKSIFYLSYLVMASIAAVSAQSATNGTSQVSGSSLQMYGGPGGKLHDPIFCPGTGSVVQLTGKKSSADFAGYLTKLTLICSDGQQVSVGSDQGSDFALSSQPNGIRSIGISYSDRIKQITYGDNAIQSEQELTKFRVLANSDNCPLNGVQVMADTEAGVIYAMTASFKCTTDSKVADIVASAGLNSEDPVPKAVFTSITQNMKQQYDDGLQEIRTQFQSIIDGLKNQLANSNNNGTLNSNN